MSRQSTAIEMPAPENHRVLAGELVEDAGYHIRRSRGTEDWLLLHTVSGAGLLRGGDGGRLVTAPGEAVLVRQGTLHDYGTDPATGHWHLLFSHFHPLPTWLALLDWPEPVPGIGTVGLGAEMDDRVQQLLLGAARASRMAVGRPELFALNGIEAALLWYDTQNPRRHRLDERVLRVMEHVDAHLADDLDIPALARVAHLSPSRLAHLFTVQVGTSPARYLEAQRMELAARLLEMTADPVAEVARRVGYRDPLYFSRRFRARHEASPTHYRAQRRDR
jgi:AraC family transcriptional regulator, arabinose operon regulatory protein